MDATDFYGGSRFTTLSTGTPHQLRLYGPRFNSFSATTTGTTVRMPRVLNEPRGAVFYVANIGASNSIGVRDFDGNNLDFALSLSPGEVAKVACYRTTTNAGKWSHRKFTRNLPRTVYAATRIDLPEALPALCYPADAVMIRCDSPEIALFVKDPVNLPAVLGKVLRIGAHCWKVYGIRNSGIHGVPLPAYDAIHPNCLECCRALGYNPSACGDADDQHIDPADYTPATGSFAP